MEIRRFRLGDEAALYQVYFSAIHVIAAHDYTEEQIEAWAPADLNINLWASRIQKTRPFVAHIGEDIVGYADLQEDGYIDQFFVSGTYSRQGVGSLLMTRIHEEAMVLNLSELTSHVSKTAEPFFAHHGFHVVERRFPIRNGIMLENALMLKTVIY